MTYALQLEPGRTIGEVQSVFQSIFPFLQIEFYKGELSNRRITRRQLHRDAMLKEAGLNNTGEMVFDPEMTVGQLEIIARERFGLIIAVFRRSGSAWLETTMTADWTLRHQNDHGREITGVFQRSADPSSDNPGRRAG